MVQSCTLLSCTTKGKESLRRIEDFDSHTGSVSFATPETWSVCGSGEICCSKVHADEGYSVFGGKGIEINMWDLEKTSKIWSAKSPQANNLGIFTPTCFTSLTFLSNDDHRKVVAGTKNHQVFLKQHLTNVVFDSNFSNEETTITIDPHKHEIHVSNEEQFQNEEDALPVKRKKASKGKIEAKKEKSKKVKKVKDEVHVEE
uniref:Uncharacterized protein n=1 Tax=Chenopodium quinoa TaxID=63459 RepID=A0A803M853_CHEQI